MNEDEATKTGDIVEQRISDKEKGSRVGGGGAEEEDRKGVGKGGG